MSIHHSCLVLGSSKQRFDVAVKAVISAYSRTQIGTWIKQGRILLNHQPAQPKTPTAHGDIVSMPPLQVLETSSHPSTSSCSQAETISLDVVYEDEYLMVINKPAGLVVHPGAGVASGTLMNGLLNHHRQAQQLPRAGIVHRLDRWTSGLMIVAKTLITQTHLSQMIAERQLQRHYWAICNQVPIAGFAVEKPIGRHQQQRQRMCVRSDGRHALTHFRIQQKFRRHAWLQAQLATGRTHQIRVHLQHAGFAIVGDPVYGQRPVLAKQMHADCIRCLQQFKRQALHAYLLKLQHPITAATLQFDIAMPDDMQALITHLDKDNQQHATSI